MVTESTSTGPGPGKTPDSQQNYRYYRLEKPPQEPTGMEKALDAAAGIAAKLGPVVVGSRLAKEARRADVTGATVYGPTERDPSDPANLRERSSNEYQGINTAAWSPDVSVKSFTRQLDANGHKIDITGNLGFNIDRSKLGELPKPEIAATFGLRMPLGQSKGK